MQPTTHPTTEPQIGRGTRIRSRAGLLPRRVSVAAAALVSILALSACAGGGELDGSAQGSQRAPEDEPSSADARTIATGLEAPWSIAFLGETPLVSERDSGRILEVSGDGELREVGTIPGVAHAGEAGLLGIAVRDAHLYAYATTERDNRIVRLPLTGDAGALGLGRPETILDGIPAAAHHNGGRIAFGPDGMLYATVGDAGEPESAQDPESLAGKILRMSPDGSVPDDNPFPGSRVYTLGHRNPQGIAWAEDGAMYASEFGQNTWDELNEIEPGANYGWPEVEGIADEPGFVDSGFVDPVQQWAPADASPSGIAILDGAIHIANLRGERLRSVPLDDPASSTERFSGELGRLRDAVVAPDGSLWLLTNNTDGRGDPESGDDRIVATGAGSGR